MTPIDAINATRKCLEPMPSLMMWLVENAQKMGIPDMVPILRERTAEAQRILSEPIAEADIEGETLCHIVVELRNGGNAYLADRIEAAARRMAGRMIPASRIEFWDGKGVRVVNSGWVIAYSTDKKESVKGATK